MAFPATLLAQITGKVTDTENNTMAYVSVVLENTYVGTSTNVDGVYNLNINKLGKYVIVFKRLGYKTVRLPLNIDHLPYQKNIVLEEDNVEIEEIIINNTENPADRIMRKAIAASDVNSAKNDKYYADYYSRGNIKITDLPKIIKNKNDPQVKELADTANSGYLYLSETFSKIAFQKPNKLYENVIASKISGDDRGYSYNTAVGSNFDFYGDYIDFQTAIISPLADIAFSYYTYRLESSFESDNKTIHKIKVIAKRDKEPVVEGFIYIVDESYEIYAVDFNIKGYRINQPLINNLKLTQHYVYNQNDDRWVKSSQFIDFKAGFLGLEFKGSFSSNFNNYRFVKEFDKNTFGKVIVNIEKEANQKDSTYWITNRPIPLLNAEIKDYLKKDSIQNVRSRPAYIDSVDQANNKFELFDVFSGYTYRNTPSNQSIRYSGLINISSVNFNPVQGWNMGVGLNASQGESNQGKQSTFQTLLRYGLADEKFRINGLFRHRFNTSNYATIELSGGSDVFQYNGNNPIHSFVNMISSLLQKRNYIKLYESNYAKINYSQIIGAGITINSSLSYQNRKSLFNNTNYSFAKTDRIYLSNNPLLPHNYTAETFSSHSLFKFHVGAMINFGEKYIQRPNQKIKINNDKYPTVKIHYTQAFGSSIADYNYSILEANVTQSITMGNKGTFEYNLTAGKLFNAAQIAFMDYKHFNGNEIIAIVSKPYIESFLLLPYYDYSTKEAYFESHLAHNFKGFIMNKIPLISRLQWHLNIGHNFLATNKSQYQEFTAGFSNIGWGKYRLFKVNYVRSYRNNGQIDNGVVLGLNF